MDVHRPFERQRGRRGALQNAPGLCIELAQELPLVNVKEPTLWASETLTLTLTPARTTGTTNPNLSAAQAGVDTNPCLVNICNQRGALRATISAS